MEKRNFINGYYLLEHDLKEILSFIEPVSENFSTYSHRLYSLFIRACTEFEANCKAILLENGALSKSNLNINDYYVIHTKDKYKLINNYCVKLQVSKEINLTPLLHWEKDKGPIWYSEYNEVKHARVTEFSKAKLGNVLNSMAGVYILLYARFGNSALCQYQETELTHGDKEEGFWKEESLFKIKPPKELYC